METHNAAETEGYAIRSVLNQTYSDLELLICDDSSADGSLAEIEKFGSDPRVRIFRSKKNQGPYNIRNALIAGANWENSLRLPIRTIFRIRSVWSVRFRYC